MLNIIAEMIISLVPGAIMICCGLFFERHIYTEIGNCGISVPSAKINMVKWMYAQAIGPKILIIYGEKALILTALLKIGAIFFHLLYNRTLFISLVIDYFLIVGSLIVINDDVEHFLPVWLSNNDKEEQNNWIDTATEYARNAQYMDLYKFARSLNKDA